MLYLLAGGGQHESHSYALSIRPGGMAHHLKYNTGPSAGCPAHGLDLGLVVRERKNYHRAHKRGFDTLVIAVIWAL